MDPQQFRIPKQNDDSLLRALVAIRDGMAEIAELTIRVTPHANASHVDLPGTGDAPFAPIEYVLAEASELMPNLQLFDRQRGGHVALTINRQSTEITDLATVHWSDWGRTLPPPQQSPAYVKLMALARKHLRAPDVEANLSAGGSNAWDRYRDSQQVILNSLEETGKTLLVEFNRRSMEAEAKAKARYEQLEVELREKLKSQEDGLTTAHTQQMTALDGREAELKKRSESFNTKEARYVARQEQQKQLDQIQKWLEGWSLTKGTTSKRWPVAIGYVCSLVATGLLTLWFSSQNMEILKSKNLTDVAWWQWALLSIKSILPLVAFTTFLVYFIRWSSSWARQHSEEEFRNRARVLDIGRSMWLLEAVRDAQDNQKELPPDLVKELSRNLFTHSTSPESGDLHPQAISEMMMQGLSSIRVKSSDGSEVEATRGKKT